MAPPYSLLYPLGLLLLTALQSHCSQCPCPPQQPPPPPGSGPSCLYVKPSEGGGCPNQSSVAVLRVTHWMSMQSHLVSILPRIRE